MKRHTVLAAFLVLAGAAHAEEPSIARTIEDYCIATADKAGERRMAKQAAALKELQTKVEERITLLEQRKQELEALIKQREELRDLADKGLVEIYAGMDSGAAAVQMEKLDLRLASSVLRQLKPRLASAILNEMKPETAAKLVRLIAIAAEGGKDGK